VSTAVDGDERLAQIERLTPRPGLPIMSEVVAEIACEAEGYVAALDRFAADRRAEEGLRLPVRLAPYWERARTLRRGPRAPARAPRRGGGDPCGVMLL
jgi:hypothetical protein